MADGVCVRACVCARVGGLSATESREQKVQWSERLKEEAQANVREGEQRGHKASRLIALSDSAPAADGFFSTLSFCSAQVGSFGVKPSRKC